MFSPETKEKKPPLTKAQKRRKRCRNCSLSLGLWLLFGFCVTKIIMGAEFGCSLDNKMIVYLIVSGGVILLITVLFIALIIAFGADTMFSKKMKKLMRVPIIVCLIHLPWLIVGSVWGFRNLKDVLDGCTGDCCNEVLVFFAVSTVLIDWILTILTIISIHYMDISRKQIIALFFDEPPVFVDVGTQHDPVDNEDDIAIKDQPIFEEVTSMPSPDETHIITSKRVKGIVSVQDANVTNETSSTPVESFLMSSPRQPVQTPSQSNLDTVPERITYQPVNPVDVSNLPNLADSSNDMKCDLLPIALDNAAVVTVKKNQDSKKGKGKSKKNKKA